MRGSVSFEETKDGLAKIFNPPMHISFDDWERMTCGMELCDELEQVDEATFHTMIQNEIRAYIEASITKGMRVTSRGSFENAAISALRVLLIRLDPQDLSGFAGRSYSRPTSLLLSRDPNAQEDSRSPPL